jgi:hypothetical protein
MFRGWRLANSYHALAALGSGTLVIDAKNGTCAFNGRSTETLSIGRELSAWLAADLATNNIPPTAISSATLTVSLTLSTISGENRVKDVHHIAADGKPVRGGRFHQLSMKCESDIATDEAHYSSTLSDVVEWPENWP